MLIVGDLIKGIVVDVDYEGQGVIKHEGYVIFVKGLLLGEEAEIKIINIKKSFGQGIVSKLIKSSEHRVVHPQSILGSCDLLHMNKHEQLKWQQKTTHETLTKIMGSFVEVEETITDHIDMNYRNKSVFHVLNKQYLSLGLYHRDDHKLIEVTHFVLADEKTNQIVNHLNLNKVIIDPKVLKHIVIRTNQLGEALVTLVSREKSFTGMMKLVNQILSIKHIKGITINVSTNDYEILGKKSYVLFGENRLTESINHFDMYINDRSFFQINLPVAQMAYQIIKDHLIPNQTVIDAYSGVGSVGYYLIDKIKRLIMIESNADAVQMAKLTKETYTLNQVEIIEGRAEQLIQEQSADVLIVDPPRNGLMPELLQSLEKTFFKQIFYLSCDAKTLARDLKVLSKHYHIVKVYPIRMFYHTTSLETLVILYKI